VAQAGVRLCAFVFASTSFSECGRLPPLCRSRPRLLAAASFAFRWSACTTASRRNAAARSRSAGTNCRRATHVSLTQPQPRQLDPLRLAEVHPPIRAQPTFGVRQRAAALPLPFIPSNAMYRRTTPPSPPPSRHPAPNPLGRSAVLAPTVAGPLRFLREVEARPLFCFTPHYSYVIVPPQYRAARQESSDAVCPSYRFPKRESPSRPLKFPL
jgi:hypothetical protein